MLKDERLREIARERAVAAFPGGDFRAHKCQDAILAAFAQACKEQCEEDARELCELCKLGWELRPYGEGLWHFSPDGVHHGGCNAERILSGVRE